MSSAPVIEIPQKPTSSSGNPSSPNQLSPRMQKNACILIAVALFTLFLIAGLTMYERAHDPDWWKHVGIRHDRGSGGNGNGPGKDGKVILLDDGNMFMVPNRGGGGGPAAGGKHRADDRPLNGRGAESRRIINLDDLKNGTDFIADYDVDVGDPGPPAGGNNGECSFPYVDLTSPNSTWVGKWISHWPNVAVIPEFLTDRECDQLIEEAKKTLFRSQVAPYKNSGANPVNEVRTSSQAWLNPSYGIAHQVVDRIMDMMSAPAPVLTKDGTRKVIPGFERNAHEELQILKYEKGQHYHAHNDYFAPELYGKQANNRAVTVFLYLSNSDGYTNFPRAGGHPPPLEYKSCSTGLRVVPRKRTVAVFYDMDCRGVLDPTSLHGGCAPSSDALTKWGGTLWLRRATP